MSTSFAFGTLANAPTGTSPDAITCVGTTQSGAPAMGNALNVLTTAAGQVAAVLPANHPVGSPIIARVSTATAGTIFPPVGGAINGGATNAAYSVAQNKPTLFFALPNGLDYMAIQSL